MKFPLYVHHDYCGQEFICDADRNVIMTLKRTPDAIVIAGYVVKWLNRIAFITCRREVKHTRDDWLHERNEWKPKYGVQGGWQPEGGGKKPAPPTTGSGVQRA